MTLHNPFVVPFSGILIMAHVQLATALTAEQLQDSKAPRCCHSVEGSLHLAAGDVRHLVPGAPKSRAHKREVLV